MQHKKLIASYALFSFGKLYSPHILVPGHIRKLIVSIRFALICFALLEFGGFDCRVFTDKSRVQQNDVGSQDGLDHLQDAGMFSQVHHPGVLKMDIVEAVLCVLCTCLIHENTWLEKKRKSDSFAETKYWICQQFSQRNILS